MRILHLGEKECVLCGTVNALELHHVYPRGQGGDDVRENLVWLCFEEHRRITLNDPQARHMLGLYLVHERRDVIAYILSKLGEVAGQDWLERRLLISTA